MKDRCGFIWSREGNRPVDEVCSVKEEVNHPERYGGDTTYECIKVLEAWLPDEQYKGFLRGNALKYLCRVGKKDEVMQELKKAQWYLNKLIEKEGQNEI